MEFRCVYVPCILYVAEAYYEIIVISVFAQEFFKIGRVVFSPAVLVLSVEVGIGEKQERYFIIALTCGVQRLPVKERVAVIPVQPFRRRLR